MNENQLTKWTARTERAGDILTELLVIPTGEPSMPTALRGQYIRHNQAMSDQYKQRVGAMNGARVSETRIVGLAVAIDGFAASITEPDYYTSDIVADLLNAFNCALNLDLGRLDGSVLSAWACTVAERFGIAQ